MMFKNYFKTISYFLILFIFLIKSSFSEIVKDIKIIGNDRISNQTIKTFANISLNQNINKDDINFILKDLYNTNFFENISVKFEENILIINVKENPIIDKINILGIKSNRIKELIEKNISLKSRSSFNELYLKKDKENIQKTLKDLGYYFPTINTYIEDLNDNKINITYNFELGISEN